MEVASPGRGPGPGQCEEGPPGTHRSQEEPRYRRGSRGTSSGRHTEDSLRVFSPQRRSRPCRCGRRGRVSGAERPEALSGSAGDAATQDRAHRISAPPAWALARCSRPRTDSELSAGVGPPAACTPQVLAVSRPLRSLGADACAGAGAGPPTKSLRAARCSGLGFPPSSPGRGGPARPAESLQVHCAPRTPVSAVSFQRCLLSQHARPSVHLVFTRLPCLWLCELFTTLFPLVFWKSWVSFVFSWRRIPSLKYLSGAASLRHNSRTINRARYEWAVWGGTLTHACTCKTAASDHEQTRLASVSRLSPLPPQGHPDLLPVTTCKFARSGICAVEP